MYISYRKLYNDGIYIIISLKSYDFIITIRPQGIIDNLSFLHDLGVAHRDLNPSNILVNSPKKSSDLSRVKLGDFGVMGEFCGSYRMYEDTYNQCL